METVPGSQRLLVRQMTWEADDVLSITLVRPDGGELPEWTLGSHIDLILPPDIIRQYSLCSDPANRTEYQVAVLKEPQSSGGSRYIHETMRPGDLVEVAGPRNNFPLIDAPHYLIIAGGIGVTPLLPMTFALAERGADWHLLYGGRRRASMAFLDRLSKLDGDVVIRPEDQFGLLDLKGAIEDTPEDTAVYCCGPEVLIAAVEAQCEASGRPAPHVERFKARPGLLAEQAAEASGNTAFDVILARSGKRFTIPPDKSIIQVLKENRVFVPTSCTEGYCGVCETEVLEGIPDHRDDYLTPEKRASNKTMMVCCGRSKTPELVLKL